MPIDDCIYCLRQFQQYFNKLTVIWHGGEPTVLGIDYVRTVIEALNEGGQVEWHMQTNGTLLNDNWFQLAKEYDIQLGLSWDGIHNEKTRGVQLDLEYLRRKKREYDLGFGFLMTVTPDNAVDLIANAAVAFEQGFEIDFNHLFGEGIDREGYAKIGTGLLNFFNWLCLNPEIPVKRPFDNILNWMIGKPQTLCEHLFCPGG